MLAGVPCHMMFVKVPKAASSTMAGVVRRVAAWTGIAGARSTNEDAVRYADEGAKQQERRCVVLAEHIQPRNVAGYLQGLGGALEGAEPDRRAAAGQRAAGGDLIMIGTVRDPAARALSGYYHFEVSRAGASSSAGAVSAALMDTDPDFQAKYLLANTEGLKWWGPGRSRKQWAQAMPTRTTARDPATVAAKILADYDFVAVAERLEESVAALSLVLNVSAAAVVLREAAKAGAVDDIGIELQHPPRLAPPSPASIMGRIRGALSSKAGVATTAASEAFRARNAVDTALHAAASARLDATIAALGGRFHARLEEIAALRSRAASECEPLEPSCPAPEHPNIAAMQDCYIWDEGCGFRCTDATARAMGYEPPAGAATGVPAELFPGEAEQRTGLVAELCNSEAARWRAVRDARRQKLQQVKPAKDRDVLKLVHHPENNNNAYGWLQPYSWFGITQPMVASCAAKIGGPLSAVAEEAAVSLRAAGSEEPRQPQGAGTLRRLVEYAPAVYVLCGTCDPRSAASVPEIVPSSALGRTRVLRGIDNDACHGLPRETSHQLKATLLHSTAVRHAAAAGVPYALFLEEDAFPSGVQWTDAQVDKMQAVLARWQEWDMIKLSFTYYNMLGDECMPNCGCKLGPGEPWCTVEPYCDTRSSAAYFLSSRAFNRTVNLHFKRPHQRFAGVDVANQALRSVLAVPPLVDQRTHSGVVKPEVLHTAFEEHCVD